MLALDEGRATEAAEIAERVLRRIGDGAPLERVPAFELLARARAAAGEFGAAEDALAELTRATGGIATAYVRGRVHLVRGEVARLRGAHEDARRNLEDAIDPFGESSAPYETAQARAELSRTLAELGRDDAAEAEAAAARETFERLGVASHPRVPDETAQGPAGELTPRELEVLRLVAQGLSDAEIAERLVVSPHTVHRHVANVRTKLRLPSRAAAVAYASREGLI